MKRLVVVLVTLLTVAPAAPAVRFAIIGDRTGGHQEGIYEQVVAAVAAAKPEFLFTVGDHIEGYTEDTTVLNQEWHEYDSIVAPLAMPLHLTPGNHDITTDGQLPSFVRYNGPPFYSLNYKDLHFIVLDNSRWESSDKLPTEQLDWLVADLGTTRKARFTFVFMHKPFWDGAVTEGKPDTLHKLFKAYGVDAVFAGHYHQYFSGTYDGIRYTVLGSSGGETEPGPTGIQYHWTEVTVDDKKGITITPVLLDGERRAWDDVTVADMRAIGRNELGGLSFEAPVLAGPDLAVNGTAVLRVSNLSETDAVADTLRWDVPEGWTVTPASAFLHEEPSGKNEETFTVQSKGQLFPVPSVSLKLPYAPGKTSPVKRSLRVARAATASYGKPVIDGELREKAWQKPQTRFFNYDGGPAKTDSSRFYFTWDDSNLYLAAVCFDPAVNTIKAQAGEQDAAVYNDDCVGYFLQPDTSKGDIYQVYFNSRGIAFDQKITVSDKGEMGTDPKWDGRYDAKTTLGKDRWTIEARIPLDQFGAAAKRGDAWGLNFRRKEPGKKSNADWQPISYDPNTFGLLLIK